MPNGILVDSNVLMDVLTADPVWLTWSSGQLDLARKSGPVIVNPIICAELAPLFNFDWPSLDRWLLPSLFTRQGLPFEASAIAAAAFRKYRSQGGTKSAPLPDFYIGAHAESEGYTLLTRDVPRYRTYFPKVPLIVPPGS
ncbi:type II toxin-antitoxin system VapC family toxin [Haloferula sp. BvORR071]|uniref:PIN domain-containing protein n=1 Tax=Haloferula sp. BvORR071 TaxID=1396141 RepID=UPI00054DC3A1